MIVLSDSLSKQYNANHIVFNAYKSERVQRIRKQKEAVRKAAKQNQYFDNDFCYIRLSNEGDIITVIEKTEEPKYHAFTCFAEDKIPMIWNTLSYLFDSSSNYNFVKMIFTQDFKTKVRERVIYSDKNKFKPKNYTDINNCSEKELSELPGINIIYAKRIIKRREEIGGFKDSKEFFDYIKVTDRIRKKLTKLICCNKFKVEKKTQKTKERIIDI
ncbi:helix-hairpin-helix domain-containing protein [bacterium]|nr:helix-hairpin-helix domain-containing protein [bacterium]